MIVAKSKGIHREKRCCLAEGINQQVEIMKFGEV
jgi:hypothetical protein